MMDVLGLLLFLGLFALAFIPFQGRSKGENRNLKGVRLSLKQWALLGDIAALKQVSQSRLVSAIVEEYLQERIADKTRVGRKSH
jgi:hypothetical protein